MLKIVNITNNINGGAGRAAYRLHQSLLKNGIQSTILSLNHEFPDDAVNCDVYSPIHFSLFKRAWNKITQNKFINKQAKQKYQILNDYNLICNKLTCETSSLPFGYTDVHLQKAVKNADIINLHWVDNFLDYPSFFTNCNKPIVWTLHDMNVFKGLFHYEEDELLNKAIAGELDNRVKECKRAILADIKNPFNIVAPSKWLTNEAKKSEALKNRDISTIPYSLNHDVFYYKADNEVRKNWGIAADRIVLIFVAQTITAHRKGLDLLFDAFNLNNNLPITVIAIGNLPQSLNWNNVDVRLAGPVYDNDILADFYSAADAFVIPSREDNLPNVMLEAMACGTPVIGFPIGGINEYVMNGKTGILAQETTAAALSEAIVEFCSNMKLFNRHTINEFAKTNFNDTKQANAYMELYTKGLKNA